ncbi:hypothetical protein HDU97_003765 [Phlyctochytrium planicorne]|nr:hypothetical protein HDU97_003765 [Phlyctochytrium planicorne]
MSLPSFISVLLLTMTIPSTLVAATQAQQVMSTTASTTDVFYLVDCKSNWTYKDQDGKPKTDLALRSIMVYFLDVTKSQNHEVPERHNIGDILESLKSWVKWEVSDDLPDNGNKQFIQAEFYGQRYAKAYINATAGTLPPGAVSGKVVDNYKRQYICRKGEGYLYKDIQPSPWLSKDEICYNRYACVFYSW